MCGRHYFLHKAIDCGQHCTALGLLIYSSQPGVTAEMWSTCRSRGILSLCLILESLERASGDCILLLGLYLIVALRRRNIL